jgi:glycosyltransferase involved in cell wall biosynthesis
MQRILFVNEMGEISGVETLLLGIITHLDSRQFEPVVMCPPGPFADHVMAAGIEHISYTFHLRRLKTGHPYRSHIRLLNPLALLWKLIESYHMARIVREYEIDLVHTNSLSAHLAGRLMQCHVKIPVIWHIHTYLPRLLFRFLLPDRIVFVSHAVRQAAFPGDGPESVRVIYNGVHLADFDPDAPLETDIRREFGLEAGQELVALIAHFSPVKGHMSVVEAWPLVLEQYPDARLLLVGKPITDEGPIYFQQVQERVKALGIEKTVIFAGFRRDIPAVLAAVDVLVSFTINDTLSVLVIEAMSMKRAIVGANSGGIPELLVDGESGLLVDLDDQNGLASAINRLLADASLRDRLGTNARKRALAHFQLKTCVGHFEKLYSELINQV